MKPAKKIFTRLLMNNWGGVSHKVMEFHEYVNLFSGKSGSGKSTVMDAIQVILYGSVSSAFLNKAADDARNKRSVLSYLRGAQKDGSSNRDGQDFCAQIVLELEDTGLHTTTCIGAAFEIGKNDTELKKYTFFSHSGKLPEDEYLDTNGVPYTIAAIKKLVEKRSASDDNRMRGDVNRVYPSKESYLNTLYDVIFGYVEPGRLMTMEKSAIALRMTNGTGQFIRDYMFPKSKEDTVSTISEQLGAYREIKERVEDLENRIELLSDIRNKNISLHKTKVDLLRAEKILRCIDVEGCKVRIEAKHEDLEDISSKLRTYEMRQQELEEQLAKGRQELLEVRTELKASDFGQKEKELENLEETIGLLAENSRQWRSMRAGLLAWDQEDEISAYVSNPALQLIEDLQTEKATKEKIEKLKKYLNDAQSSIEEELEDLTAAVNQMKAELREKREMLEDLRNDRKPYRQELKKARQELQGMLSRQYGRTIQVEILADLFDITDEKWKSAIEGRMGRIKRSLVTAPEHAVDAAKAFRKMKTMRGIEDVDLIDTAAIAADVPNVQKGTLYEAVKTEHDYVDMCLKRFLGRIRKCETVEELHAVHDGVTPDCYSYSNYIFRHLRKADYDKYACIGTRISRTKLHEMEDDVEKLERELIAAGQAQQTLREAKNYERLTQSTDQLLALAGASDKLEDYYEKQSVLVREIQELKEGTRIASLKEQEQKMNEILQNQEAELKKMQAEVIGRAKIQAQAELELKNLEYRLYSLEEGFVVNDTIRREVLDVLKTQPEGSYRKQQNTAVERLTFKVQEEQDALLRARNQFNRTYPNYGFDGTEKENDCYDKILDNYKQDYEPKYKEDFQKQYDLVYRSLRENVIATIHGEIKAAFRHRREINRMLARIRFSDSIYQIDIMPAQNENGQFYEMLMAEELDSKVLDNQGFDGQMTLGEDLFYQKYEKEIQLLTDKFMPPRAEDAQSLSAHRLQLERYADYRNYLTFSMYEKVTDEAGNVKKNYVDEMAGRDSGGEGQNPKYVALLAGFAMLYMQQNQRDSKIRLVLLDEAFSKMDKERSEVCLHYARELDLQLIVCVPDERLQSLIRNVDSVYGFRRYQNQVTMMHIDKGDYLSMVAGEGDPS